MNWKNAAGIAGLFAVVMTAAGQTLSVESAPFTFPVDVGIRIPGGTAPSAARFFRYSGPASREGMLTFSWSFPGQHSGQRGAIAVYSLAGRTVKTIPVSTSAGSVQWNMSGISMRGVYLARIVCGSDRHTLKLLVCR